jgi:hypothetical protein
MKWMKYRYEIQGSAAHGQTWTTEGMVETMQMGEFPFVPQKAIQQSFMKLTEGKAVYGSPGVACIGPYTIKRMLIEEMEDDRLRAAH